MAEPIKDLVKDLTKEELLADFKAIGEALGIPADTLEDGDPAYAILVIFAERFAEVWTNWGVPAIRAGFLDYARGAWLTLKAALDFNTERKEKSFASTQLYAVNKSGSFYTLNPGDVRVTNAAGKGFRNVTGGALPLWPGSGDFPKVLLDFQADEAGTASNTPPGGILTQPSSAPAGVEVQTNATAIVGSDEEQDPELVKRARLVTGPLSPAGPRSAYEYIALSCKRPDGTAVDVTRVKVHEPGGGLVQVFLAGSSGPTSGDMATAGTDVFIVWTKLLLLAVPVGLDVEAYGATAVTLTFSVRCIVDAGSILTDAEATAAATDAVQTHFDSLPIGGQRVVVGGGGFVFANEVAAKASESAEGIIRAQTTDDLATDAPIAYNEVAIPAFDVVVTRVTQ